MKWELFFSENFLVTKFIVILKFEIFHFFVVIVSNFRY